MPDQLLELSGAYAPISAVSPLSVGEETMDRRAVASSAVAIGSSQTLRLTFFRARKSETVSQFKSITGGTAAAATPTLCRYGLWTVNESTGDCALVMSTPNDTALFAATATAYPKAASVAYAKVAGTLYAYGILVVSGAAVPTFQGATPAILAAESALADRLGGFASTQADLPASFNLSGISASAQLFYGVLLP